MRYRFDGFAFDPDNLQLSGPGGEIPLRPMTVRLLQALIESAPQLLRHDELLDQVWGHGYSGMEHTVNSHINRLRAKIETDPSSPRRIVTVWGVGYRLD